MALMQANGIALVGLGGSIGVFVLSANLVTTVSDYLPDACFFCTGQTLSFANWQNQLG
jgi:hypothetical protein